MGAQHFESHSASKTRGTDDLIQETDHSSYIYLSEIADQLVSARAPLRFDAQLTERAMYSRISNNQDSILFDYLLGVWKRSLAVRRQLSAYDKLNIPVERRTKVLDDAMELAVSYSGLVLNPDMLDVFPSKDDMGAAYLGHMLIGTNDFEQSLPRLFLNQFIDRFIDDGLADILQQAVKNIVTTVRALKDNEDYQPCVRAMSYLVSFNPMCKIITNLPDWNPAHATARSMEMLSILGPFFSRATGLPDTDTSIPTKYFSSNGMVATIDPEDDQWIGSRNQGDVQSAQSMLRDASTALVSQIHTLILVIIKSGPESKAKMIEYLARCITLNFDRSKMRVDRTLVSTDGFLNNIFKVCLKLTDPIMNPPYAKLSLIDPCYLIFSEHLKLAAETKINVDQAHCDSLWQQWKIANPSRTANFVTEIFFFTLSYAHFGFISTIKRYLDQAKEAGELRKHVANLKQSEASGAWASLPPHVLMMHRAQLQKFEAQLDLAIGTKLAVESALFDKGTFDLLIQFYNLVMVWVFKMATGNIDNSINFYQVSKGATFGLQLFPILEPTMEFKSLPEWIIEDICEFYLFILK